MSRLPEILHLDDSDEDRLLFSRAFVTSGVRAVLHSFSDAAQVLLFLNQLGPYIKAARPRLIVLDLNMPRVDGYTFLDLLKGNPLFATIPVVVLTGVTGYTSSERYHDGRAEEFYLKPSTLQELAELIRTFDRFVIGSSTNLPATPSST
jgi:two-component system response regulator